MKLATWARLATACLAVALALSLSSAPSRAQSQEVVTLPAVNVSEVTFPASVTTVTPATVTVNAYGTLIELPSQFANYTINGHTIAVTSLEPGQTVEVVYPAFSGTVQEMHDKAIVYRTLDGRLVLVPVSSLTTALRSDLVFVRLSDGTYVKVPLSKAVTLQNDEGATIISALPVGASLSPYAAAEDDVMSGYNRNVNWSEGVRIQKDPSKLIQDQSIDGDSNF